MKMKNNCIIKMKVRRRNVKRSKCLMKGMVKDISIRKGGK
jgi:hypothetical protein